MQKPCSGGNQTIYTVYLSLGSNLGAREDTITRSMYEIDCLEMTRVSRKSDLYETEPVDACDNTPWFLNNVVEIQTRLSPEHLLKSVLEIENRLGRTRTEKNESRVIDIDIVLYGTHIISSPHLQIPHPRYSERNFVLDPLADLIPDYKDPVTGITIKELRKESKDVHVVHTYRAGNESRIDHSIGKERS